MSDSVREKATKSEVLVQEANAVVLAEPAPADAGAIAEEMIAADAAPATPAEAPAEG